MAPDIIIDVAQAMGYYECGKLVADWNSLKMVPACRNNRVYCLARDYATIPGPRLLLLFQDLENILHEGGI
jgi:ABC-type Fe3+-hydroxamate transport system substrate-binding protein